MIKIHVTNLNGDEFMLQATLTNDMELNGNQSVSCTIYPTKVNKAFINDITEMWEITDFDDVTHKIIYFKKRGEGDSLTVDIKAIPLFFDTFDTLRIYEEFNDHMTAMLAFTRIFSDTPFNFVLVDTFDAVQWEGFGGGETRLETFKRALERYRAEFRIAGNTIYLHKLIGRDTQFQYRYRLNASNIEQENDASAMWTYAKGYGDYGDGEGGEDWQDAKLKDEYTSPLANIIGKRDAPPIKSGNITDIDTMREQLKTLVDESLKISVSATIHDLRKQGYSLAQPELGDRVFLIDERIGLDDEVRIVDLSITRNWKGEVLNLSLTFGSEGIAKRHQSNLSTAINNITDLLKGKIKLPNTVFDSAITSAALAIKNAKTELTFPESGGIWGIDKDNPNYVTGMTSRGFMVSTDGGATAKAAVTGEGVVAETIIGRSIIGVNLTSEDTTGYFHVNGPDAEFFDMLTQRSLTISPDGIYGKNRDGTTRFQADRVFVTSSAFGTSNVNVYLAAVGEGRMVDYEGIPGDGAIGSYRYLPFRASGFYGTFLNVNPAASNHDGNIYVRPLSTGELKVTLNGTTDIYQPLRASSLFGNAVDVNTGTHLYLRAASTGEVRATVTGTTDQYAPIRANEFRRADGKTAYINETGSGSFLANNVSVLKAGGVLTIRDHFYIGVHANEGGELRVTNSYGYNEGGTISYRPVRAREFITDTSLRENKRNIDVYDEDILDYFRTADVYLYNRANEITHTKKQLGMMIDELPYETYSDRGDGFGLYSLVAFLFRGLKQAIEEIDQLKGVE